MQHWKMQPSRGWLSLRSSAVGEDSAKAVVDGDGSTDKVTISRSDPPKITGRIIANKESQFNCYGEEGVCRLDLSGDKAASIR